MAILMLMRLQRAVFGFKVRARDVRGSHHNHGRRCSRTEHTDCPYLICLYLKTHLISNSHATPRRNPSSIPKHSILGRYKNDYLTLQVKCNSKYLFRRSNPTCAFSNPFKIPERTRLKRSTGFTNLIKYKRTSTLSDENFIVDVWSLNINIEPKYSRITLGPP
jgi:hypothetical protein